MNQQEYYEALGRLSDQYMFDETMTNAEYLRLKKTSKQLILNQFTTPKNETFY